MFVAVIAEAVGTSGVYRALSIVIMSLVLLFTATDGETQFKQLTCLIL